MKISTITKSEVRMNGSMIPQMYYSVAKTMTTLPTMTCHNDRRSVIGGIEHSVICSNRLFLVCGESGDWWDGWP